MAQQGLNFPAFQNAFKAITDEIVKEIAAVYKVPMQTTYQLFNVSDPAITAVLEGRADCTDPFYRQWTLSVTPQVQRSVQLTPACTLWATTLSISWNGQRNAWKTLDGKEETEDGRQGRGGR